MNENIRQATITLSHFNYDVPVLYREDGTSYVPVRALCQMLGIRADTRIPRWRKILLWEDACKLPVRLSKRGIRVTWCIPCGAISFLLSYFDWSYVSSERRAQLHDMVIASMNKLEQARKERLDGYQKLRPLLFLFLTKMSDAERILQETAQRLYPLMDAPSCHHLDILTSLGHTYLQKVTSSARNILHEQGESLIVDAVLVNEEGKVSDTFSLPLFPVMPSEEESEQLLLYGRMLLRWYEHFHAFLEKHGFPRTSLIETPYERDE